MLALQGANMPAADVVCLAADSRDWYVRLLLANQGGVEVNVYIAGPMRGYPQYNFPAFDQAAELAKRLGYRPFSPAALDRAVGVDGSRELPPGFLRECVLRDFVSIYACQAIAMLPGWRDSVGARAEYAIAKWLQLNILDAVDFMPLECQP